MVVDLDPIGRRIRKAARVGWVDDNRVIDGPEIEGYNESGHPGGKCQGHETSFAVAVGRCGFVVEKALEEMADKESELAALRFANRAHCGLDVEGEDGGAGELGHEEFMECVSHGRS